jgi:hypothetical protein
VGKMMDVGGINYALAYSFFFFFDFLSVQVMIYI